MTSQAVAHGCLAVACGPVAFITMERHVGAELLISWRPEEGRQEGAVKKVDPSRVSPSDLPPPDRLRLLSLHHLPMQHHALGNKPSTWEPVGALHIHATACFLLA